MDSLIAIDIGGTFTDCIAIIDSRIFRSKAPTTTYNLSVGFRQAIEDCARQRGIPLDELLGETRIITYSTTLAMNTLIQRTGTKLGLITTAGHEHTILIGRSKQWADGLPVQERRHIYRQQKPEPLIPFNMIIGVKERIDCFGQIIIPIQKEEVRAQLQSLVDKGAQGFVVSLLWSHVNPTHEKIIKEVISEEYPDRYLGNMPILLSSEVQPKWHEYPRTNMTILCAYLHTEMTGQLSSLSEELRDYGYKKPLNIINNIGGMSRISRTRAVDTYGAGPAAGLLGSAYIASKVYNFPNVIVTDMGGTSFDFGLIIGGSARFYQDWPVVDHWATESSMVEVNTIGAGGGSIAWLNRRFGNRLEVGPASAGSYPGPACYDLGGKEPTVTDADVVLGYVNPDYFLGGRLKLNREQALKAVEKVASQIGLPVEQAALAIRKVIDAKMGNIVSKEVLLKGYDPKEFTLFAYGGAGPTHCVDYASYLKIPSIVTFPYASVFCALGATTMDLRHVYEISKHITLRSIGVSNGYIPEIKGFNTTVDIMREKAFRDMKGEGFDSREVMLELELEMRYERQNMLTRLRSPRIYLRNETDIQAVLDAFNRAYIGRYGEVAADSRADVDIENLFLFASVILTKPEFPKFEMNGESPEKAFKGRRPVYWEKLGCFKETDLFEADLLQAGNVVKGPAIIEARDTTFVIPQERKCTIDQYLSAIVEGT
ncbi:hydantoinase/oxoprolinase family protein [Chloroflexota bacterium]